MPSANAMDVPIQTASLSGLLYFPFISALRRPVNLVPNQQFIQGTVLGEITGQTGTFKAYAGSTIGTPAALTPVTAVSATGGSLAPSQTIYVVFTWRNGSGETVKSAEATVAIPAGTNSNSVKVTAPQGLPPGSIGIGVYVGTVSGSNYFVGYSPSNTYTVTSLAAGTQAPPGASTAIAATDGSQVAKGILPYSCITDSNGQIYLTNNANSIGVISGPGAFLGGEPCIEVVFGGADFYLSDLINLDQAAITAGFGRIQKGSFADAAHSIFRLP